MAREQKLYELEEAAEKVILVGIETEQEDAQASLDELEELVHTAGAVALGRLIQKREAPHPSTYLGKGKVEELKEMLGPLGATGVVCDDELSPAQLRHLSDALNTKVMDRTMVILDIFAARAASSEGKIQVELAQLQYRLTRLTGFGVSMSRLGGGIGTRGPGEKKLEADRRYIKERIGELKKDLAEVKTHRELLRSQRQKKGRPVAALVGYTNAGKSTILNGLTQANVLAEDKLFATLDTTTRALVLPEGSQIFLTDTVGFIRKLSHHLVDAFRATLEEASFADLLIHVVDASNPNCRQQMEVVYRTLEDLGCGGKPVDPQRHLCGQRHESGLYPFKRRGEYVCEGNPRSHRYPGCGPGERAGDAGRKFPYLPLSQSGNSGSVAEGPGFVRNRKAGSAVGYRPGLRPRWHCSAA